MNYLYFSTTFFFCCVCICATFLFCSRILFLAKTEKVEPVQNIFRTEKQRTALKTINRQEALEKLLENG